MQKYAVLTGSRMLWFAQASVALAGFFREDLSCIKKTTYLYIFP